MDCSQLRTSLVALFSGGLEVSNVDSGCVITLPLKTPDARYIDVFIEPVHESSFTYVHDGGKNTAELFAQGIHATDTQEMMLRGIADAHGAHLQNGRFQIACPNEAAILPAVFAIGQCATLAMIEVISHEPKVEDEALTSRVGRALSNWQPSYVKITKRFPVNGRMGRHRFDFVTTPVRGDKQTVGIKILHPSVGPHVQARLYGFMAYDIAGTDAAKWPRLAIVAKSDLWTAGALMMVSSLSTDTILLKEDQEERIETSLPPKMTKLMEAA